MPDERAALAPARAVQRRVGIDWAHAFAPAITAGALLTVALVVPFGAYMVSTLAAGALAVALYARRAPQSDMTPGEGARMGAVCGIFGFVVLTVILAVLLLTPAGRGVFRQVLHGAMQQASANNPNPEAQEMLAKMNSPAGLAMIVTMMLVFIFGVVVALGSAGGAIAAWMFQPRKNRPDGS